MKLLQFLLTRFNVPVGYAAEGLGIDEAWLRHRFGLFEKFCLPSVLAQDCKKFEWILMVDVRTPERWLSRLQKDLAPAGLATRVMTAKSYSEACFIRAIRQAAADKPHATVLTTRLDNDDAIAPGFLSRIAREARKLPAGRNYVINYAKGCQTSESGVYAAAHAMNPFISLVTPAAEALTAFHANHHDMGRAGKVVELGRRLNDPILWMQVIHGRNVTRRVCNPAAKIALRQIRHFPLGRGWRKLLG